MTSHWGRYVYYAEDLDDPTRVKIGCSGSVAHRMRMLGARLIKVTEGGQRLEQQLHRLFAVNCVGGEWFNRTPAMDLIFANMPNASLHRVPRRSGHMTAPLTPQEAARQLRISAVTVRRMVEDGRLTGDVHPITGRIDVDPRSVTRLLASTGADLPEDAA